MLNISEERKCQSGNDVSEEKLGKGSEDFFKDKITSKELQKYEGKYSEAGLLNKIKKYGKVIGLELLFKVVQLWYVLQKPDVPAGTKALIMGALGYLIAPLDFIPDLTPMLGYSDDLVAITFALIKVQGYIDDDVNVKARRLLGKIFDKETIAKLD